MYIAIATFNSCNTDTSVLSDVYTRIPEGCGPEGWGCTYQAERECTCYNCYVTLPWPHCIYIDTYYIRLWFLNNSTENLSYAFLLYRDL